MICWPWQRDIHLSREGKMQRVTADLVEEGGDEAEVEVDQEVVVDLVVGEMILILQMAFFSNPNRLKYCCKIIDCISIVQNLTLAFFFVAESTLLLLNLNNTYFCTN